MAINTGLNDGNGMVQEVLLLCSILQTWVLTRGSGTKWLQSDGTETKCKYDEPLSSRQVCPDYYNTCLENVEEIQ